MAVDKRDANGHWRRHAFELVAIAVGADDDGVAAAADAVADGDVAAVDDGAVAAGRPLPNAADFDS